MKASDVANFPIKARHYKGGNYTIAGIALYSEDVSKRLVMYMCERTGTFYVRPLENVDKINPTDAPFCGPISDSGSPQRFELR